jgi:SHS2 domain found in N terminus of Rpb7p/Rpc25p/MJ0397
MFILVSACIRHVFCQNSNNIQSTLTDLVQITPEDFQKRSAEALEDNINQKYANKVICFESHAPLLTYENAPQVIQQLGLCICMWDLYKSSDALIGHGTGIVHVNGMVFVHSTPAITNKTSLTQSRVPHGCISSI